MANPLGMRANALAAAVGEMRQPPNMELEPTALLSEAAGLPPSPAACYGAPRLNSGALGCTFPTQVLLLTVAADSEVLEAVMRAASNLPLALSLAAFIACGGGAVRERTAPTTTSDQEAGQARSALETMVNEQKLIRSGELRIRVDRLPQAVARVDSIARQNEGLLADTRVSRDDRGAQYAEVTVRIPAPRFNDAFARLKALGEVQHEAVTTQDVTKAYLDLETRLAVKEETAGRLRRLLAQGTGDLAAVLAVERELDRVITEIEQLKGEKRYLDQRVNVSTITLTLLEPGVSLQSVRPPPIREAFRNALAALSTSVAGFVYLVTVLAPWLALAGLVWWLVRAVRRRRRAA